MNVHALMIRMMKQPDEGSRITPEYVVVGNVDTATLDDETIHALLTLPNARQTEA